MANYLRRGTHNSICDICGFKFKRDQMMLTWDNLLVCRHDYDEKQPQLTIRIPPDKVAVESTRTEDRTSTNLATWDTSNLS